jgi:hypothetical protein
MEVRQRRRVPIAQRLFEAHADLCISAHAQHPAEALHRPDERKSAKKTYLPGQQAQIHSAVLEVLADEVPVDQLVTEGFEECLASVSEIDVVGVFPYVCR